MRNIHVRARLRQAPLTAQQRTPLFIYDLRLIKTLRLVRDQGSSATRPAHRHGFSST
jgi:hypothetical protein